MFLDELRAWVKKKQANGQCIDVHVYTPQEWAERKEEYDGPFGTITFEGDLYREINYGDGNSLAKEFYQILNKHDIYMELGYSWYGGFFSKT